jgi:hypothetical protein
MKNYLACASDATYLPVPSGGGITYLIIARIYLIEKSLKGMPSMA